LALRKALAEPHVVRLVRLSRVLASRKKGVTLSALVEELGVSKSTVYRDLLALERAGFPITRETVNGEARHGLSPDDAPLPRHRDEALALVLAKVALAPLAGTPIYKALTALANGSRSSRSAKRSSPSRASARQPVTNNSVVQKMRREPATPRSLSSPSRRARSSTSR